MYKKRNRSYLVSILILCIILYFSSCKGQNDFTDDRDISENENLIQSNPLDKSDYYEIVILRESASPKSEQYKDTNYFRNLLKEKFNFGYEVIGYPGSSYERLALMLSAGDYPEIIRTKDEKYLRAYIEEGALIPLDDLMVKYGADFMERHKDRIPYWRVMSGMDDGKVWFYTTYEPSMSYGNTVAVNEWKIRSDIIKQQGYPELRNEDDLFDLLKRGVEDNPVTNGAPTVGFSAPLHSTSGINCIIYTINMGRLSHMTLQYGSVWDPQAEMFIDAASDYSYKDGLKFFNRLWREGLFDRESVTYTLEIYKDKMMRGYSLSSYFWGWDWNEWNRELSRQDKEYRYVPIPMMLKSQAERGEKKIYPLNNGEIWSSVSITNKAQYPERLMEVINFCSTDEGLIAAGWGEEGVQYEINDKGFRVLTGEAIEEINKNPDYFDTWQGIDDLGFFCGLDKNGQNFRMQHDNEYLKYFIDPEVTEVYSNYGWNSIYDSHNRNKHFDAVYDYPLGLKMIIPAYTYQEKVGYEKIDIMTNDYTIRLITADSDYTFEMLYEEMLRKRTGMGLPDLIEKRNNRYTELTKGLQE